MTTDAFLTVLNVVLTLLLTGIGIEMVNNPPGDDPKKKWFWRLLFLVLGTAVVVTTAVQASITAREQRAERTQHDVEQGRLEGKLTLMSDTMSRSSCPSTAQIGEAVKRELVSQRYRRVRTPIAEGRLANLSSELLLKLVPTVTEYLGGFRELGWYGEDVDIDNRSWEDSFHADEPLWQATKTPEEWKEYRRNVDEAYHSQLRQLLSDADALRVALRNKLPSEAQTPEDDAEGAAFAKAIADGASVSSGLECCPASIRAAANYLDSLAKRVSLVKTLKTAR